jgi:dihydrofolate synthase/folylpolyglutamate synthase
MRTAAQQAGHPELGRRTILVAGTNGKGSVCAYLTELFRSAGLKVGTTISPHLVNVEERIRLNGLPISKRLWKQIEHDYSNILQALTYFEKVTMMAFLVFRQAQVDVQVIEVGIGGRLDATNICDPDISVITRIGWDHQDVLGNSLEKIAFEKAGIMRPDREVVVGSQRPEVIEVLKDISRQLNSKWVNVQKVPVDTSIKKLGSHQLDNASIALSAFEKAKKLWKEFDFKESSRLHSGLLWSARQQWVSQSPPVLVDGCHNEDSVYALVQSLKKLKKQSYHCIFGCMDDKDSREMINILSPFVNKVSLPVFYPERQKSFEYLESAWKNVSPKVLVSPELRLNVIWRKMLKEKEPCLVVGSLYLAGAFLKLMQRSKFQGERRL